MLHGPDIETAAKIIVENVVSALEHGQHGIGGLEQVEHAAAVSVLMRALLNVMPTEDSATLAAACNSILADIFAAMGLTGPRVEAVDPDDGSVTMTATRSRCVVTYAKSTLMSSSLSLATANGYCRTR